MENRTYENMFSLAGKKALISGGTGGLGSAIARAFLQNGADVAVCGGHPEKAAPLEKTALQAGRGFLPFAATSAAGKTWSICWMKRTSPLAASTSW